MKILEPWKTIIYYRYSCYHEAFRLVVLTWLQYLRIVVVDVGAISISSCGQCGSYRQYIRAIDARALLSVVWFPLLIDVTPVENPIARVLCLGFSLV